MVAVCGKYLSCTYDFFVDARADDVSFFIIETKKKPKMEPEKSSMMSLTWQPLFVKSWIVSSVDAISRQSISVGRINREKRVLVLSVCSQSADAERAPSMANSKK